MIKKATITQLCWDDVRKEVASVNQKFADIIDQISPECNFSLYKVRYPFGSVIVDEGVLHLPLEDGTIVPIDDSRVASTIKADFEYSGKDLPIGISLKHSFQESVHTRENLLPLAVVSPGAIFSLWDKLGNTPPFHPVKMFHITAGARCIFMLPNIGDVTLHKNLKRDFNVRLPSPKSLLDHWEIFKTIIHHPSSRSDWAVELLFFSGKWLEKIRNDPAWRPLYLFLLEKVWEKSAFERNQMFYDLAFSRAQANRNLKPNPYLADTVKHLIMISAGTVSGFGVALDDEFAPIKLLQEVYIESYGLRKYAPTIMLPMHFNLFNQSRPIYYSLSLPTTLEFSPKSRKLSSTLQDLSEIRHITNAFTEEIKCGKLKIEDTVIGKIATEIEFEFFHNKPDIHGEIKLTQQLLKDDPMLACSLARHENREFADSGAFVRGCIRVSHKK